MTIVDPRKTMAQSLEDSCGFTAYRETLRLDTNIAADVSYQKNFTGYYRVRRDALWLQAFYQYLEENKTNRDISFETILRYLSGVEHTVRKTGKNPGGKAKTVEASFASKMLATINRDHPIWDSQVLHFFQIKVDDRLTGEDKIRHCVEIYRQMEQEITQFIHSPAGKECIALFDETFPNCRDFSAYKKIDFYLWNLGK